MQKLQQILRPGAHGHGAVAAAMHLHRQRVARIRYQQRVARKGSRLDHLSHHPVGVDQRLSRKDPVPGALVENDSAGKGIHVHRQQLGDQDPIAYLDGGIQQAPESAILRLELGVFLQPRVNAQVFPPQSVVLFQQSRARSDRFRQPGAHLNRQINRVLQRIHDGGQNAAKRFQVPPLVIGGHQRDGNYPDDNQPRQGRGTTKEERLYRINGQAPSLRA